MMAAGRDVISCYDSIYREGGASLDSTACLSGCCCDRRGLEKTTSKIVCDALQDAPGP